jgi:hypothetical protein
MLDHHDVCHFCSGSRVVRVPGAINMGDAMEAPTQFAPHHTITLDTLTVESIMQACKSLLDTVKTVPPYRMEVVKNGEKWSVILKFDITAYYHHFMSFKQNQGKVDEVERYITNVLQIGPECENSTSLMKTLSYLKCLVNVNMDVSVIWYQVTGQVNVLKTLIIRPKHWSKLQMASPVNVLFGFMTVVSSNH